MSGEPASGRAWGTRLTGRSKVKDSGCSSLDNEDRVESQRKGVRKGWRTQREEGEMRRCERHKGSQWLFDWDTCLLCDSHAINHLLISVSDKKLNAEINKNLRKSHIDHSLLSSSWLPPHLLWAQQWRPGRGWGIKSHWNYTYFPLKTTVRRSVKCQLRDCYLIAFLSRSIVAVGVREMDVTGCDLHHFFYVSTTFPDDVGVLGIGHVHLQSYLVHLGFIWIVSFVKITRYFKPSTKEFFQNNICLCETETSM